MSAYGFRNVSGYTDALAGAALRASFEEWLRWGLLECGAVTADPAGALRPAEDPAYPAAAGTARVWEGARPDWVWQPAFGGPAGPVAVGGTPVTTGVAVDYPRGRVVFAAGRPKTAAVACPHAHRRAGVYRDEDPWLKRLDLFGPDAAVRPAALARVTVPAWVVGAAPGGATRPYEMGSNRRLWRAEFRVLCLAGTDAERSWLADALVAQEGGPLPTFDPAAAPAPLDPDGTLAGSPKTFPELCGAYPWRPARVVRVTPAPPARGGGVFWGTVGVTLEATCP